MTEPIAVTCPLRPTDYDAVAATTKAILQEVLSWLGKDAHDPAEYERDLADVIEDAAYRYDGYDLAKALDDRHHWDCDEELVDILSGVAPAIWIERQKLVKQWVIDNGITLRFAVGTAVKVWKRYGIKTPLLDGEVVELRPETAEYHVFCESLGHVREGVGSHAIVVASELLEADNP